MTDDKIALRELLEKGSDASFLREMIGFAAARLMELETEALCGAGARRAQRRAEQPAQRLSRPRLGDPRRHGRAAHPEAAPRQLLPGLPGTAPHGREGADRGDPGSLCPGHLDPLGRRSGARPWAWRASARARSRGCAARSTSGCRPSCPGRSRASGRMSGSMPPTSKRAATTTSSRSRSSSRSASTPTAGARCSA